MYSIELSLTLTFLVFSGLILKGNCQEKYHSKCFNVDQRDLCYFMVNDTRTDWESAWSTCRILNATLPVISSARIQTVLMEYLRQNVSDSCVWTAGRYIADKQWRWTNGKPLRNEELVQNIGLGTARGVNAILNIDLKYESRSSKESNFYICQFSGIRCSGTNSVSWSGGCLRESNNTLSFNEARHTCIDNGGDLAIFSEAGVPHIVSDRLNRSKYYWIGLRQNSLIWNTSGAIEDIKYQSFETNDLAVNGCILLLVPGNQSQIISCSARKRFVCQTEYTHPKTENIYSVLAFDGIVTVAVIGSAIIVSIALLIIIGRNIRNTRTKSDRTYEELHVHHSGAVDSSISSVDNSLYTNIVPTQQELDINQYDYPSY